MKYFFIFLVINYLTAFKRYYLILSNEKIQEGGDIDKPSCRISFEISTVNPDNLNLADFT